MADQGIYFQLWDGWENDEHMANLSKEDMAHWVLLGGYLRKHGNSGMTCLSKPAIALQKKLMLPNYEALLGVLKKMPGYVIEEKQGAENTVLIVTSKNWSKYQVDLSVEHVCKHISKKSGERNEERNEERRKEPKEERRKERSKERNKNIDLFPNTEEKREEKEEKEIIKEKEENLTPSKIFSRPTAEEVRGYAKSLDFELDADKFCDFYIARGWKVGKSPMRDWRAAVRYWRSNILGALNAKQKPDWQ